MKSVKPLAPHPGTIKVAEKLLADVMSGKIQAFVVAAVTANGETWYRDCPRSKEVTLIGALELAKQRMLDSVAEKVQ